MTTTRIQQLNEMRAIAGMPPLSKKQEAVINEARMPLYDPNTRTGFNGTADFIAMITCDEDSQVYFSKNRQVVNEFKHLYDLPQRTAQIDVANFLVKLCSDYNCEEISTTDLNQALQEVYDYGNERMGTQNDQSYVAEFNDAKQRFLKFVKARPCKLYKWSYEYDMNIICVREVHPESAIGPKQPQ